MEGDPVRGLPHARPTPQNDLVAAARAGQGRVLALPTGGAIVHDARGEHRWMRVTWHGEAGVVVLSVWRDGSCVATMRVERGDVPVLVNALVEGLAADATVAAPPTAT